MLVERKGETYVWASGAAYIIDSPECIFVWVGRNASANHKTVTAFTVTSLQTYEGSPVVEERCEEGNESIKMLDMLRQLKCMLPSEASAEEVAEQTDDSAYLAEKAKRRAEERQVQNVSGFFLEDCFWICIVVFL